MYGLKQQLMMALRHSTDLFIRTRDQHCRSIWASRCSSLARLSLSHSQVARTSHDSGSLAPSDGGGAASSNY